MENCNDKNKKLMILFETVQNDLRFWTEELTKYGYDVDNAIAAAQAWGQMCGIANTLKVLNETAFQIVEQVDQTYPKLYKEDYENKTS